jgi:hypothetical protein
MHGHVGIEAESPDVAADQLFNRLGRHRRNGKTVLAHASRGTPAKKSSVWMENLFALTPNVPKDK